MRFESLTLRNFKSYEHTEVAFEPGVTVIHGVNGSGKSSLLEAAFFALYGSEALVGTLDEVITTGAEESEITLSFMHDNQSYVLTRELRIRGERAQTTRCELETPHDTISGARPVRNEIASLLRMDADAFLNCAYVRQGEVNKLIHASPSERQDMIDELLQLGVLETYRDRGTHARRGIASLQDEYAGQLEAITTQIAQKEAEELTGQLNTLETQRNTIDERLEQLAAQVTEAEDARSSAKDTLDRLEERREEVNALAEDIDAIVNQIAETATEREECEEQIARLSEQRAEQETRIRAAQHELEGDISDRETGTALREQLEAKDESLREDIEEIRINLQAHVQAAEQAEARAEERRELANAREEEANTRASTIETENQSLAERRDQLVALQEEQDELTEVINAAGFEDAAAVDAAIADCEAALSDLRERQSALRTRIETISEEIEEMEALIEAGQCPTCGQPVDGAPAVGAIEEEMANREELESTLEAVQSNCADRETELEEYEAIREKVERLERITDRIASAEELITEKKEHLDEQRAAVESLQEEASSAREEAEQAVAEAAAEREAAAEKREQIAGVNASREELRSRLDAIDALLERYDKREDIVSTIETMRERRDQLEALNDERRERLAEKRERHRSLAEEVDDDRIASARDSLKQANAYLAEAEEEQKSLRADRDAIIDQIGGIQNELAALRELRDQRDTVEAAHDAIGGVHAEVEELERMYGDLRRDLREQNVAALERMLNETFDLVYQNDAYERIELDGDYAFTVYQKDGSTLDPSLLSGGERALFNLSLRCAIYRLLSEGIEGTAPLPPLILDEPTVYLDSGHVGRLVELVEAMRALGVEQIILVSHDDELLRAADVVLSVEKDPTTNRSAVTATPATAGMLALD